MGDAAGRAAPADVRRADAQVSRGETDKVIVERASPRATLFALLLAFSLPALAVAGCTGERVLPTGTEPDLRIDALVLAPENSTVVAGGTKMFTANWRDFDGNWHLPGTGVKWESSSGVINDRGEFFAPEQAGPVRIRVSYRGTAASTDLTVIPNADIFNLAITPATIEVEAGGFCNPVLSAVNRTGQTFYPRANWSAVRGWIEPLNANLAPSRALEEGVDYRVTQNLTPQRVFYYAPRSPGSDTLRAVIPGTACEAVSQVKVVPGPAVAVRIEPRFATVPPGGVQSFTATVEDRYGNPIPGAEVTWFASAGAIDRSGDCAAPTTVASSVVSARYMGITGTASVNNANIGAITRIEIRPANPQIARGDSQQFVARGYDAASNEVRLENPTWETNNGSIDGFGFYYSGNAAVGPARIRVYASGIVGETWATIVTRQ